MGLLLFENDWRDVWNGAEPSAPVGAIFTKPEVTAFILDLAGYSVKPGLRLASRRLLEPSCGDGAFITIVIERLLASELQEAGQIDWDSPVIDTAVRACDVNSAFVAIARENAAEVLCAHGCPTDRAVALAERWIEHADFLLKHWREKFDFVVGNPPYVRIEDIPAPVMSRYRELYQTCGDRADLYVAFFEQGLRLLSADGSLSFICANRFAKNQYGRSLRQFIAQEFRVRFYVNLEHTQPFVSDVSAYPCVIVIDRARGEGARAASLDSVEPEVLNQLVREGTLLVGGAWSHFPEWYPDGAPWIATNREEFLEHAGLAERFPVLEESGRGTRVGIGVATGNDDVFISPGRMPEIEAECQLPLVMAADVTAEAVRWSGHYLINPHEHSTESKLRDLSRYPGLRAYFEKHRAVLAKRHTARKQPDYWFRTIDRVNFPLAGAPKLLLPDIQAGGVVGYATGAWYPQHNLYWIISEEWNLAALQALLRSSFVLRQVRKVSVQMRGGSVRYQAQVLRQLRIPRCESLTPELVSALASAGPSSDQCRIDELAAEAFN